MQSAQRFNTTTTPPYRENNSNNNKNKKQTTLHFRIVMSARLDFRFRSREACKTLPLLTESHSAHPTSRSFPPSHALWMSFLCVAQGLEEACRFLFLDALGTKYVSSELIKQREADPVIQAPCGGGWGRAVLARFDPGSYKPPFTHKTCKLGPN